MIKTNKHNLAVLIILDGWGIAPDGPGNAIAKSNLPNLRSYKLLYPYCQLQASGEWVGLPKGENGNSEVGHLNIGAGSIIYQDLPRINMAIADGTFLKNPSFIQASDHAKKNNSALHLMGLIGLGGVHSSIEHLYALLNFAKSQNLERVYLHLFTDGRDSPPNASPGLIKNIDELTKNLGVGKIASISGRYYAMDRDKRWERTEKVYNLLVLGEGETASNHEEAIQKCYSQNISDEFITPTLITENSKPVSLINDNDSVIFFNFRIDRPRQLTECFVLPQFETGKELMEKFDPFAKLHHIVEEKPDITKTFTRKKILKNLCFVTMTEYEKNFPVLVAFPKTNVKNPLASILSLNENHQLHLTETEKERFVTYYFNGQREDAFQFEDRIIIPSPKVSTYDKQPEMSSRGITDILLNRIKSDSYQFIVVNYPNADMVAHSGILEATVKACEAVDYCIGEVVKEVLIKDGAVVITADHGNAEEMINNETKETDTEHSKNPVLCHLIANEIKTTNINLPTGILADIAPTILNLMGIRIPSDMTGRNLLS